jgi:hypothetical protein
MAMVSAVMSHLAIVRLGGRGGVIGSWKPFAARPFGEHAEEAADIVNDLAGVLVDEIAPNARLPDLPAVGDLLARIIVVCSVDPKGFASSGVPLSGIARRSPALGRFSAAPRSQGW